MIANLDVLGSLVRDLFKSFNTLFYVMLPVGILFSVVINYLKSGDANYPDIIKRAFVASILLVSFPEISNFILDICDGLALKIDNMSGIETFMRMAEEKSQMISQAKNVLLLKFDDLFISILSFGSFIILYIARYITIALYYFYWVLLSVCSPFMILCYLFPGTARITSSLYKGLIEIGLWKVVWAIQSAILTSLAFGNIYKTEGDYLTLMIMNFVVAIAMLFTPMIVKSLVGEGVQATAQTIGTTAVLAAAAVPAKGLQIQNAMKAVYSDTKIYAQSKMQSFTRNRNQ